MNTQNKTQQDRDFLLCAVSCNLMGCLQSKFPDYIDQWGLQHYYDLCVNIVDEMMKEGSEYSKYADDPYHFQKMNTDLDWYHIDLSYTLVTLDRLKKVAGIL